MTYDMEPVVTSFMVLLINGDATTIKCLVKDKSVKNLGLWVQLDGQYT